MECGVGVQDVTGLDVASVRDAVALVSQDSTLFNEDVAYNIAYGNPDADAFAVGDAARNAQVTLRFSALCEGSRALPPSLFPLPSSLLLPLTSSLLPLPSSLFPLPASPLPHSSPLIPLTSCGTLHS